MHQQPLGWNAKSLYIPPIRTSSWRGALCTRLTVQQLWEESKGWCSSPPQISTIQRFGNSKLKGDDFLIPMKLKPLGTQESWYRNTVPGISGNDELAIPSERDTNWTKTYIALELSHHSKGYHPHYHQQQQNNTFASLKLILPGCLQGEQPHPVLC